LAERLGLEWVFWENSRNYPSREAFATRMRDGLIIVLKSPHAQEVVPILECALDTVATATCPRWRFETATPVNGRKWSFRKLIHLITSYWTHEPKALERRSLQPP
jgi:hypothetical protein